MTARTLRALRTILLVKASAFVVLAFAIGGVWWLRTQGLDPTSAHFADDLRRGSEPRYAWRSVDKKHWQAGPLGADAQTLATTGEDTKTTDAREQDGQGCGPGMVRVRGLARQEPHGPGEIERLQNAACTDWISKEFPARCRVFDADAIASAMAPLPVKAMDFCVDRFEYPNVRGQNPEIVFTFHEAENACKANGKRLCNESEWTFACEGEEARPYPYGYTRDATACVVDRDWRPFSEGALTPRDGSHAKEELDRLWQAEPSGSRGACKSPYGVYDMTGNVDEWTRSVRPKGFASILKGGYWGPVRARCRPSTRAHDEDFIAYQQGFRCCAEADSTVAAPPPASTPKSQAKTVVAVANVTNVTPIAPDLDPPTPPENDGDEIAAIKRSRLGIACGVSRGAPLGAGEGDLGAPALLIGALALAGALATRARRARRRKA